MTFKSEAEIRNQIHESPLSMSSAPLSPSQRQFLHSYVPTVLAGDNASLGIADRDVFVRRVNGLTLQVEATAGKSRVVENLHKKGVFQSVEKRLNQSGQATLHFRLSHRGANALFDVMFGGA
ncbi:hypothetical protein [Diaphorobacter sp. LR2014-1]|uniref:hypothetical protein n=1 Tax=Diaphorobacter sp. LR2014-1 TaxID=1933219 RepID=UPI000CDA5F02|nr:hypothetical protein [Diaphorobacter sp. LR2014-1]POR07671.1 hypothetical protein BV908_19785 [Diaphorobacter sp. LR2014-1]